MVILDLQVFRVITNTSILRLEAIEVMPKKRGNMSVLARFTASVSVGEKAKEKLILEIIRWVLILIALLRDGHAQTRTTARLQKKEACVTPMDVVLPVR